MIRVRASIRDIVREVDRFYSLPIRERERIILKWVETLDRWGFIELRPPGFRATAKFVEAVEKAARERPPEGPGVLTWASLSIAAEILGRAVSPDSVTAQEFAELTVTISIILMALAYELLEKREGPSGRCPDA